MRNVCLCCATYGPTERHHVGGRKHSDIEVNVCTPCHRILTAWETERRWVSDRRTERIIVGAMDLGRLIAMRADPDGFMADMFASLTQVFDHSDLYGSRPASTIPELNAVEPDTMMEREYFLAAMRLVNSLIPVIADIIGNSAESLSREYGVIQHVAKLSDALDTDHAFRVLSSPNAKLKREIASFTLLLATAIEQAGRAVASLAPGTIVEMLAAALDGFHDTLANMTGKDDTQ